MPLQEQTPEHWAEILKINLIGTFLAVKHAARVMTPRKRGSIICTASVAGLRSGAGGSPYSASKAGVVSLVQTTAYQLGGSGVRINAICPGLIETGMTQPIFEQARARGTDHKIGQLNPLRRAGAPSEIAQMALFLASDDASYVNGQAFPVDGGSCPRRFDGGARGTGRAPDASRGEPSGDTPHAQLPRRTAPLHFRPAGNRRVAERRSADRHTGVQRHRPALASEEPAREKRALDRRAAAGYLPGERPAGVALFRHPEKQKVTRPRHPVMTRSSRWMISSRP